MQTVIYNTESGTFQFAKSDVLDHLKILITEINPPEADIIEKYILTSE